VTPETPLSPQEIVWLSVLATAGLVLMWGAFWYAVSRKQESVKDVLLSPAFFRTVSVMGVIAATVVLTLAGRLKGDIASTLLGSVVGYVLGQWRE
jgi:RsiW-degrading membrane proteinase PrsW (M82 family)